MLRCKQAINEQAGLGQMALTTHITEIAPAPGCRVSVALPSRPADVTLEPQGHPLEGWTFGNGRCEVNVPGFVIHQVVVFHDRHMGSRRRSAACARLAAASGDAFFWFLLPNLLKYKPVCTSGRL